MLACFFLFGGRLEHASEQRRRQRARAVLGLPRAKSLSTFQEVVFFCRCPGEVTWALLWQRPIGSVPPPFVHLGLAVLTKSEPLVSCVRLAWGKWMLQWRVCCPATAEAMKSKHCLRSVLSMLGSWFAGLSARCPSRAGAKMVKRTWILGSGAPSMQSFASARTSVGQGHGWRSSRGFMQRSLHRWALECEIFLTSWCCKLCRTTVLKKKRKSWHSCTQTRPNVCLGNRSQRKGACRQWTLVPCTSRLPRRGTSVVGSICDSWGLTPQPRLSCGKAVAHLMRQGCALLQERQWRSHASVSCWHAWLTISLECSSESLPRGGSLPRNTEGSLILSASELAQTDVKPRVLSVVVDVGSGSRCPIIVPGSADPHKFLHQTLFASDRLAKELHSYGSGSCPLKKKEFQRRSWQLLLLGLSESRDSRVEKLVCSFQHLFFESPAVNGMPHDSPDGPWTLCPDRRSWCEVIAAAAFQVAGQGCMIDEWNAVLVGSERRCCRAGDRGRETHPLPMIVSFGSGGMHLRLLMKMQSFWDTSVVTFECMQSCVDIVWEAATQLRCI